MGIPLPSARLISSMMHLDVSNLDSKHSMMLMQFAQFLDHDITFTPVQKGALNKTSEIKKKLSVSFSNEEELLCQAISSFVLLLLFTRG